MKRFLLTALLSIVATSAPAIEAGVPVMIGEPGFYGRIDISNTYHRPQSTYNDPALSRRAKTS